MSSTTNLRFQSCNLLERGLAVCRFTNAAQIALRLDHLTQAFAEDWVVVGNQDTDLSDHLASCVGSVTRIVVPRPGADSMA